MSRTGHNLSKTSQALPDIMTGNELCNHLELLLYVLWVLCPGGDAIFIACKYFIHSLFEIEQSCIYFFRTNKLLRYINIVVTLLQYSKMVFGSVAIYSKNTLNPQKPHDSLFFYICYQIYMCHVRDTNVTTAYCIRSCKFL